jgi:acyl carrier protein
MTQPNTLLSQVKDILAREWNVDAALIPNDAELNVYEKWDSLGHIGILLALEAEFGIEINPERVQSLLTLPKIVAFLEEHQKLKS